MGTTRKILILEDEQDVARLYAKYLKANGYDPVFAFDGLEGLEQLKKIAPELILLDLNMPKMGGVEFYQHICDSNGKPKYPVLVLTGRADMETLFKNFHVEGFIIKPFEGGRLLKEVDIIIKKQYWKKGDGSTRRVVIIDDQEEPLKKIVSVFSNAGYKTATANSGVAGIEMVIAAPPDLVIVNLSLADITGDLVILRLQQMAKTRGISYVLYVRRNYEHDALVMEKFATKSGVKLMCEYSDPAELLDAAVKVFQQLEREDVPSPKAAAGSPLWS